MEAIDVTKIDWNKLTPEQFSAIEKKCQENNKLLKESKPKKPRTTGHVVVQLKDKFYRLKTIDAKRLQAMKSEKSRDKFITKLMVTSNPIEEIK